MYCEVRVKMKVVRDAGEKNLKSFVSFSFKAFFDTEFTKQKKPDPKIGLVNKLVCKSY